MLNVSYSTSACRNCFDEMSARLSDCVSFSSFPSVVENGEKKKKRESNSIVNLLQNNEQPGQFLGTPSRGMSLNELVGFLVDKSTNSLFSSTFLPTEI